jgi:hypothetical protein
MVRSSNTPTGAASLSARTGRRLTGRVGDPDEVRQEIAAHRDQFQRLCAEDVVIPTERGTRARESVGVATG